MLKEKSLITVAALVALVVSAGSRWLDAQEPAGGPVVPSALKAKPRQAKPGDDESQKLKIVRFNVALLEAQKRFGKDAEKSGFRFVVGATDLGVRRLFEAELALAENGEERLRACVNFLELARAWEGIGTIQIQIGALADDGNMEARRYLRADAEVRLLEEKRSGGGEKGDAKAEKKPKFGGGQKDGGNGPIPPFLLQRQNYRNVDTSDEKNKLVIVRRGDWIQLHFLYPVKSEPKEAISDLKITVDGKNVELVAVLTAPLRTHESAPARAREHGSTMDKVAISKRERAGKPKSQSYQYRETVRGGRRACTRSRFWRRSRNNGGGRRVFGS